MYKFLIVTLSLLSIGSVAHALEVGDQAPCVVLNHVAIDKTEAEHCIRDPEMEGQAIVLDFFSITCSDCIASFPAMNEVSDELGDAATFRLVAIDRSEADVRDFIERRTDLVTHEVALDSNREARRAYGIVSTPAVFVLDPQNVVVFKHEGRVSKAVADRIKTAVESIR